MTLQEFWRSSVKSLIQSSTTPYLDAELLLAKHLNLTRAQLYSLSPSQTLTHTQQQQIEASILRRQKGEPIAYLLGKQEFWSLSLEVTPAVLIPRPETELLVQLILEIYPPEKKVIADLGTGSGAIALAIATERPHWQCVATDVSEEALMVAERNRQRHHLKNIEWRQGNWCNALSSDEKFDAMISNPPYLSLHDSHLISELALTFEPKNALIAGQDGLQHLKIIICDARKYLLPGARLFVEHGYNQAEAVRELFLNFGYVDLHQQEDLSGLQRVTFGKWH